MPPTPHKDGHDRLRRSCYSFYIGVCNKSQEAEDIVERGKNVGLVQFRAAYDKWQKSIDLCMEAYVSALNKLTEVVEQSEAETYLTESTDLQKRVTKASLNMMEELRLKEAEEQKNHVKDGNSSEAHTGSSTPDQAMRANEALKPPNLSLDYSMKEFEVWQQKFQSYFDTSNMKRATVATQQVYLFGVLDAQVTHRLTPKVTKQMPVYGDNCVMEVLEKIFNDRHPLYKRRKAFFQVKQQPGQDVKDYMAQALILFENADINEMTPEKVLVQVVMNGLQEKSDIKTNWFKQKDPTWSQLDEIATEEQQKDIKIEAQSSTSINYFAGDRRQGGGARPKTSIAWRSTRREPSRGRSLERERRRTGASSRERACDDHKSGRRRVDRHHPAKDTHNASYTQKKRYNSDEVICRACNEKGHIAKFCRKQDKRNK